MFRFILSTLVSISFLFVPSIFAQDPSTVAGTPGCGAPEIKFNVKTDKSQHSSQSEPEKALVYFIEDDSNFGSTPKPTTRMGIDGTWAGATHGNSYFYVAVGPGVHHLCASWQSAVLLGRGRQTAAAHFKAEPGGVYYFEVRNSWVLENRSVGMDLIPLDSDEGQLLANKFSHSNFVQKK